MQKRAESEKVTPQPGAPSNQHILMQCGVWATEEEIIWRFSLQWLCQLLRQLLRQAKTPDRINLRKKNIFRFSVSEDLSPPQW